MPDQVKVKLVEADGKEYFAWTLQGKSVWETLEMLGWETGGACGGRGKCGKCKFRVEGKVSEISPNEKESLLTEEIKNGQRLACYCIIKGDITIYIDYLPTTYRSKSKLLKYTGESLHQEKVKGKEIFISGMQRDFPIPIYDRIKDALTSYSLELSIENINDLVRIDRPGRPTLELHAVIMDNEKVKYIGRQKKNLYGLAIDLGSTSLFTALVSLETGQVETMASHSNMQRIYGEDIISRVSYCMEHGDGAAVLHQILINNINSMIDEMINDIKINTDNIFKIVIVGNPVMLHFFLNLDTSGFRYTPYAGVFSQEMQLSAENMGLNVSPFAHLMILPQLGGFVGADTTACLLTLAHRKNSSYILIDIGTNGEIVLSHKGEMWTASAAAGPAFEGAGISCGMRAGNGAIDKVFVIDGKWNYNIIGDGLARGICGSGIIDLVAVLFKSGCLNENGIFTEEAARFFDIKAGDHGQEITLIPGQQTLNQISLVFNQEDVRQVQLAKGAIRTAIDILLRQANIDVDELQNIYLAGAFGSYLNPESLMDIGVIPMIDANKIRNIGNAAAEGAIMALVSDEMCEQASRIKERAKYVELADQKDFQEIFLNNINLFCK